MRVRVRVRDEGRERGLRLCNSSEHWDYLAIQLSGSGKIS